MKNTILKFVKNIKEYVNYIMQVNFKELFINTVIILCIVLLSALVYAPVEIVRNLIKDFITIFIPFSGIALSLYYWLFSLISAVCCILAFMYLCNKRFEDIQAFKDQVSGKSTPAKKETKKTEDKKIEDELELPKTKDSK